jgi:hypothetical protein
MHKKRRKSPSPSPSPPPPSNSKEETKPLSLLVAEGVARLEAITKVEVQADSGDEATSKKRKSRKENGQSKSPE